MKVGYIRVSTSRQDEALQVDALTKIGCEKFFTDKSTGAKFDRVGLEEALAFVRPEDTFIVWKLDRLGRSLSHLIKILSRLKERDIGFMSLTENIDTTTPSGKLIFHVIGAIAEFERDLIRERVTAGMDAARARGRHGGRPKKLGTDRKVVMIRRLYAEKQMPIKDICDIMGVTKATLYRYVKLDKGKNQPD